MKIFAAWNGDEGCIKINQSWMMIGLELRTSILNQSGVTIFESYLRVTNRSSQMSDLGGFPLVLCADIEIYNWDGQTLYCFEACRVLITRGMQ
jgi:hypothetical protein